jgi:hypothetical protein
MWPERFIVDKITGSIEETSSGKSHETIVIPVISADLKIVLKKNGWLFNWRKEFNDPLREVYKLIIKGDNKIQGLICIEPKSDQSYIEMHLIETAPHNYGKSKKYLGVPGNLVAFACKRSFELGFEGFVGFIAKTQLIQHYIDILGAEVAFRNRMKIPTNSAKKLVNSYYKDFFNEA